MCVGHTFEFLAIPSLNKALVLELARSEFLLRRENVLLLGNSGTGKTHLALALGLSACQRGYRVRFTTAAAMVHELLEVKDEKRLLRIFGLEFRPMVAPCGRQIHMQQMRPYDTSKRCEI